MVGIAGAWRRAKGSPALSALRTLRMSYAGLLWPLSGVAGAAAVGAALEAVVLLSLVQLAGAVSGGGQRSQMGGQAAERFGLTLSVKQLFVICVAAVLAKFAFEVLVAAATSRITARFAKERWLQVCSQFLGASWEVQSKQRSSDLQKVLSTNSMYAIRGLRAIASGAVSACALLVLLGAAFSVNATASASIVAVGAVLGVAVRPLSMWSRRAAAQRSDWERRFYAMLDVAVRLAREIQVFGVVEGVEKRFEHAAEKIRKGHHVSVVTAMLLPTIYRNVGIILVVAGLASVYVSGATDVERVGGAALLLVRSLTYGEGLQTILHQLAESIPYLEEASETSQTYRRAVRRTSGVALPHFEELIFENVTYQYGSGAEALRSINVAIKRGDSIGIVGPSGSGKSTFIQLVLGLRAPTSGRILLDTTPLADVRADEWNRAIGLVPQEPELFSGTILDNVLFFREGRSIHDVSAAARLAGLHDEIMRMPQGYETEVGESGKALSGGQKQRACIARALLENPLLVVLDEPTSALDAFSEAALQETLQALHGKQTVLIIAHRLSTVMHCDRILVLRDGELDAFSPPDELSRKSGYFRDALALANVGLRPEVRDDAVETQG